MNEALEGEIQIPEGNSMEKDRYAFKVEYLGETGVVINKIMTGDMKNRAAVLAAQLRGIVPYDSYEPVRAAMTERMGWLQVSLEEDRAEFLKNIGSVIDDDLINQVWGVVQEHERIFRKSRSSKAKSPK
jgi:hypothetical protein